MKSHDGLGVSPLGLFPEILRFNFLPAGYMHGSWWETGWLPAELLAGLQTSERAQCHASQFVLQQFELSEDFIFDFSTEKKQVALLAPERLNRLVYLTGLCFQSHGIARVIRGQDRKAIKDAIGETDYFFAIKRGMMLLREAGIDQSMLPDGMIDAGSVRQDCYRFGIGSLATAMDDMPTAFIRRLQFKLPRDILETAWQASSEDNGAHARLLHVVSKELA